MSGFVIPLLVVVLVLAAGNLLLGMVMVWRHSGLAERVARLEIYQQANLTHAETRQIYERLSSIAEPGQVGQHVVAAAGHGQVVQAGVQDAGVRPVADLLEEQAQQHQAPVLAQALGKSFLGHQSFSNRCSWTVCITRLVAWTWPSIEDRRS